MYETRPRLLHRMDTLSTSGILLSLGVFLTPKMASTTSVWFAAYSGCGVDGAQARGVVMLNRKHRQNYSHENVAGFNQPSLKHNNCPSNNPDSSKPL